MRERWLESGVLAINPPANLRFMITKNQPYDRGSFFYVFLPPRKYEAFGQIKNSVAVISLSRDLSYDPFVILIRQKTRQGAGSSSNN